MLLPIAIVVLFALMGMPLFACLSSIGLFGLYHSGSPLTGGIADVMQLTGDKAVSLSTIPLFTFAGYVMAQAKTAQRLVRLGTTVLGWIPGGLALLTLWVCAFFTTFTGASGVTIVAVGGLLLPALEKARYSKRFSLEVVTGSGSVGLLFPPSLPLIVYGIIYALTAGRMGSSNSNFSVDKFLFAGIVPGLVLLGFLSAYCIYAGWRSKSPREPFHPWKLLALLVPPIGIVWGLAVDEEFRAALWDLKWELPIPFVVIGALAFGWAQIPESAALCALYVLIVEVFVYRDVSITRDLFKLTRESMTLVGAIFVKMVGATILTAYFIYADIPNLLFQWMHQYVHGAGTFLLVMNVVLLLVGCMMDIFSAIIVVVPLIVPAAEIFHIDPYHLGVIFLLNLEIGYLLPPAGLNLFIAAFRFNRPITEIYRAVVPFILLMFASLMVVTYVPGLTWVPGVKAEAAATQAPNDGLGGDSGLDDDSGDDGYGLDDDSDDDGYGLDDDQAAKADDAKAPAKTGDEAAAKPSEQPTGTPTK